LSLSATTIADVRNGGSDTHCGGTFWPAVTLTADSGITITNPTSASPTIASTNYTFVAGDVNTWWFLQSATNGFAGWYQITAVNAGVATLNAALGAGYLLVNSGPATPTTSQGIGSGSLSSVKWTIDYSQQTTAQFAPTTFSSPSSSAGTTMNWTGATWAMKGNGITIPTGITNATAGSYQITASTPGTSITLSSNWNSGSVTSGAGTVYIGGAFASIGQAGAVWTNGMTLMLMYSATNYTSTSATGNVSGGCFGTGAVTGAIYGWATSRCTMNVDANMPYVTASGISTFVLFNCNGASILSNVIVDAASLTSGQCVGKMVCYRCILKNQTLITAQPTSCIFCQITGWTVTMTCSCSWCEVFSNTVAAGILTPAASAVLTDCLVYNNTGIGINYNGNGCFVSNCVAYNNTLAGFSSGGGSARVLANCVSAMNGGAGYASGNTGPAGDIYFNCASYGNTSGNTLPGNNQGFITLTGNPFNNPSGGDFSLNNTSGAALKAIGFPTTFPAGVTKNYSDLNAVQSQALAGVVGPTTMLTGGRM
jgi:hypothetical protein